MKTLVTYCQRTGRRIRKFLSRLLRRLSHDGTLKASLSIALPFFAKLELSYQATFKSKKKEA